MTTDHPAFITACNLVGSQRRMAELLGVTPQSVSKWLHKGPPMERCPDIERLTQSRVRCEDLRPDLAAQFRWLRGTAPTTSSVPPAPPSFLRPVR